MKPGIASDQIVMQAVVDGSVDGGLSKPKGDAAVVEDVVVDVGVFRSAPGDHSTRAIANDAVMQV